MVIDALQLPRLALPKLLLWFGILIFSVHGECKVKDALGNTVSLGYLDEIPGVQYDYDNDRLQCFGEDSCRKWTISNCYVLQCIGRLSCQGAKLINNQGISCKGQMACQDAHMLESHNVACAAADKDPSRAVLMSCSHALIETDETILCFGPKACVSRYEDRITIRAGAQGIVRCNDGDGDFSCKHIIVEVKHARRACFVRNIYDASRGSRCAVVCEGDNECHKDSIRFRVQ
ncbi:hypothetical protein ACA910_011501 [Epithemia clementina (nom. ined.)]